jgi:hypothetical protein
MLVADAGQAGGEHGLARPRRPREQQVVAAGGAHLQRGAPDGLTPHVGQIGRPGPGRAGEAPRRVEPRLVAPQAVHQLPEGGGHPHLVTAQHRRLGGRIRGHDHRTGVEAGDHRHHPGHRSQRPVEPQLAQEGATGDRVGGEVAGGDQQADGDREVEAGPALADGTRRGQVDGDPLQWPREPAGEEGGAHPVARLAARRVGQAHHVERGQAGRHVHFHGERASVDAEQGGGRDDGDHTVLLGRMSREEGRAAGRSIECAHRTEPLGQEHRHGSRARRRSPPDARLAPSGHTQQNRAVGFNPYRPQRRRRSDYVFVAAAFVVVAVLLLWALLP